MKKVISIFGVFALMAGFLSSCDKEDVDSVVAPKKRLVKQTFHTFDHYHDFEGGVETIKQIEVQSVSTYLYDSEGKCTTALNGENGDSKVVYKYEDDRIIAEYYQADTVCMSTTYMLNQMGYVEKMVGTASSYEYRYDDQGHLTHDVGWVYTKYVWTDGNVTEIRSTYYDNSVDTVFYKYVNDKYPTPIDNIAGISVSGSVNPAFPMGVKNKNLPVSKIVNGKEITYEYEFDADGYPTKMRPIGEEYNTYEWE